MRARASTALFLLTLGVLLVRVCPSSADDRSASFGGWHPNDGAEDDVSRERDVWGAVLDAPCSPEAPCVHLVPHTHLDPGWRDTFEGYHRALASRIHPSVVLALAADHRKRFALADVSFLARWLEETGDASVPSTCAYDPKPPPSDETRLDASWRRHTQRGARAARAFATEETACPKTWSTLCRRLVREGRLDVVGGGWVSHDEVTTPVDLAAAQYDEGMRTVRALFFDREETDRERETDGGGRSGGGVEDVTEPSKIAWQIDPFGHAAATPTVLSLMGFERVVLNRVPAVIKRQMIRENAREFTWKSSSRRKGADDDDDAKPRGEESRVYAHVLRAHYNVPPELDFENRRFTVVAGEDGKVRDDESLTRAAAALLKTAKAALRGVTHGHALVLVGDDFRFVDADFTFGAWRDVLDRVSSEKPRSSALGHERRGDANAKSAAQPRRFGAFGEPKKHEKNTVFAASSPPLRFRWSTPREYFASVKAPSLETRENRLSGSFPSRRGSFFPYADNFPASENAWVGSFVARRALKDAVLEAATSAVVASSFAASVFFSGSSTRSKPRDVFVDASFARNVTAARRDGFLGLHHDAITGTCPADVAEDYFAMARRAVTASRRAIRQTARVALECDEDEDELLDDADEKNASFPFPFLKRAGDAFAVYNPRGDVASAAEVTVRIAPGLALVDARETEVSRRGLTPLPTQRAFSLEKKADENENARDEGNDAFAVVLGDAPPLGAAVVVAIDRDRLTPSGASNDEISIRPEDMGVTFDAHGATIEFSFASSGPAGSSRSRKKSFARLSAAAVAFPRDEHFGDGPYVSRSAAAHVFLLWVASVIGYVVGDVGVRWVLETRSWKPTRTRLFATLPTGEETAVWKKKQKRSFFVSAAAFARRRARDARWCLSSLGDTIRNSRVSPPPKTSNSITRTRPTRRGLRFEDTESHAAVVQNDDDSKTVKRKRESETKPHWSSRVGRLALAFAAGAAFPIVAWSPRLVSHAAYRALLDGGIGLTGPFLTVGVPFGAATRSARALVCRATPGRDAASTAEAPRRAASRRRLAASRLLVSRSSLARGAGGYIATAAAATCGFLFVATAAPWLDARPLLARAESTPVCRRGALFSECAFTYGGGANDKTPSATLFVRDVFADGANQKRVEWVAKAPLDSEIVARVAWRDRRDGKDTKLSSLLLDDGVGGFAETRRPSVLDAFTKGWSVASRSMPSGRFVAFTTKESERGVDAENAARHGVVFERAGTSAFLGPNFASFGVHRNALSDDGHGLGAHGKIGAFARNVDLSDARPGRLAFRFVLSDDFVTASLRRVAAEVSRPPVAVRVPRTCEKTAWSPLTREVPFQTRVLQMDLERESESREEGANERCALRFRVQNVGSAHATADGLARAVGGEVAMDPPTVPPGGLAHARWVKPC